MTIPKTYKLYIGGKFPRSESGRIMEIRDGSDAFYANVAKASRKDAREAVIAARTGQAGWARATAYNRAQVLYRVAEVLDGRRDQLVAETTALESLSKAKAEAAVADAIDTWVWYAGWADKWVQVAGNANPVAGPYFNVTIPGPVGVVAAIAPQEGPSLLGLSQAIAPIIASGNSVVALASLAAPVTAVTLAEAIDVSDVPAGVVNILTGDPAEMAPWLASHEDVRALDLTGAESLDWVALAKSAAQTLTRVLTPGAVAPQSLERLTAFTEATTVWHTASSR